MGKNASLALTLESLALNSSYLNKSLLSLNANESTEACGKPCGKLDQKTEVAQRKADALIQLFGTPYCKLFFLKCAHHLPEATIDRIASSAMRPDIKCPIKYFNYAAKQELKRLGY